MTLNNRSEIRLALPSKGRMAEEVLEMLSRAGLQVYKPNPRQYRALAPSLPELSILFQRNGDIVTSVQDGSVDFGISGLDIVSERRSENDNMMVLLKDLKISRCTLNVIVPESMPTVSTMADLANWRKQLSRPLRVATKFPNLTKAFFQEKGISQIDMISAEGTLEIAPTIGYADIIVDLISTGTTLRDNRLKKIEDGLILNSQACLIANRSTLKQRPEVLSMARQLLEIIVAYLRGAENVSIFANVRGETPQGIAQKIFSQKVIGGLQGPTISPVITREGGDWHAVHLIVRKDLLTMAINELRQVGGSGVVVAPVHYIFEEEPQEFKDLLSAMAASND
jgi:ATP phosphoribosyltransferase